MEVWAIAYYDYGQRTLEDLARSLRQATTRVVTDLESLIYTTETDVVAADAEAASGGGELTTLMNAQSYAQPSQFRQLVGLTISCIKLEPLRRRTSEDASERCGALLFGRREQLLSTRSTPQKLYPAVPVSIDRRPRDRRWNNRRMRRLNT